MIDAQLQLGDLKLVLEAAQKAEAAAKTAREVAESQLMAQSSELNRLRSRMAGAEAEMDDLRRQARALYSNLCIHFVSQFCAGTECSLFDDLCITAFNVLFYSSSLHSDTQMTTLVLSI